MATIPHPASALAGEASRTVARQDTALAVLVQYANGDCVQKFSRPDARLVLDLIADLRRASAAAGWLDEREAADTQGAA
jgi:hypothetical protein